MEGRRRQLQLIGKMLRQRDVEPIRQALDKLKNRHNQQVVLFHKLEHLRDRLIVEGDDAVAEVLTRCARRSSTASFIDPQCEERERRQQTAEISASDLPVSARAGGKRRVIAANDRASLWRGTGKSTRF